MVEADHEIRESEILERVACRGAQFGLDDRRPRPERVNVALEELAKAAARRPVGAPHRLNLIALEQTRQLRAVLGNHPRQRHGEIVPQRQIRLPGRLVLAALENLENEPVALLAVLAHQRLEVLDRGSFQRLEPVSLVDILDLADDVLAPAHVFRQEVAHPARRLSSWHRNQPRPLPSSLFACAQPAQAEPLAGSRSVFWARCARLRRVASRPDKPVLIRRSAAADHRYAVPQ